MNQKSDDRACESPTCPGKVAKVRGKFDSTNKFNERRNSTLTIRIIQ